MEASSFNLTAGEFVPQNTIAKTQEQFPDLDAMMAEASGPGKKKKKKAGGQANV